MKIIQNASALRDAYLPEDLHHRHDQLDYLSTAIGPTGDRAVGDDIRVVGPSGTGKTTLAKYALTELEQEVLELRWGYVNCLSDTTGNAALAQLVRDLGLGAVRAEGTPRSVILDRLRDCKGPIVGILDEVDMLADQRVLGSLYDLPHVSVICICIDEDEWLAQLDDRIRSRYQVAHTVRLRRYTHSQLTDILWGRVDAGLRDRLVDPTAIDHIADLAAGDARHAITLLRQAASRVDQDAAAAERITTSLVDDVVSEARAAVHRRYVERLSTHKRVLYEIIADAGELSAGDLHQRYKEQLPEGKSQSMRRRYLDRLEDYGLIEQDGEGRGTVYRVTDSREPDA